MIDRSRRGNFWIDSRFLEEHPEAVMKLLSQVIVVRCEFLWQDQQFSYQAIGSIFAAVPEGMYSPDYRLIYDHATDELTIKKCEGDEFFRSMEHINYTEKPMIVEP